MQWRPGEDPVCNSCTNAGIKALQNLCVNAVNARRKDYTGLDKTRISILDTSPTLLKNAKINPLLKDRVAAQKRRSLEKISAKLGAGGVDVDVESASSILRGCKPMLDHLWYCWSGPLLPQRGQIQSHVPAEKRV